MGSAAHRASDDAAIDAADANVQDAYASVTGSFARAHADAWDEERSGSMRQLSDLIGPAATGVDLFADAIVALTLKVIAELVITAAQIAVAVASAFVTFGAGAAVQAVILVARRKALDALPWVPGRKYVHGHDVDGGPSLR